MLRLVVRLALTALFGFLLLHAPSSVQAQGVLYVDGFGAPDNPNDNAVRCYDATTGQFLRTLIPSGSGGLHDPQGMLFGPDGNLYISNFLEGQILRYDTRTGKFLGVFASGHQQEIGGFAFGPDGNLYVGDFFDTISRYNGKTGAFMDDFVPSRVYEGLGPQPFGFETPYKLTFGPDGNLYVLPDTESDVLRFNGKTGEFMGIFATSPHPLFLADAMVFGPDGDLYLTAWSNEVLRFDGKTGALISQLVSDDGRRILTNGIAFGPDNNIYLSSYSGNVQRYDGKTGAFIDTFVPSGSGGIGYTGDLIFGPGAVVPEPGAFAFVLSGIACGVCFAKRRKRF